MSRSLTGGLGDEGEPDAGLGVCSSRSSATSAAEWPRAVAAGWAGLPIVGRAFREDLCLAAARRIEERTGGALTPVDPHRRIAAAAR